MSTPSVTPPSVTTRAAMRAYLTSLAGRYYSWDHLAIRHNSLERAAPCRFCDHGVAQPSEGPAIFFDGDALCPECTAEIAPELAAYLRTLQVVIRHLGGDWRMLLREGQPPAEGTEQAAP